jgi:tetratricopeptide (TPR) repeat protein
MKTRTTVLTLICSGMIAGAWLLARNDARHYHRQADEKMSAGDFAGAIADYDRALEISPNYARGYIDRGDARKAKGEYDAAVADYELALKADSREFSPYYHRGIAKYAKGDPAGALLDYERVVQFDPGFTRSYFNQGIVKQERGDLDEALKDFRLNFSLDPNNQDDAIIRIWIVRTQKGQRAAADTGLSAYLTERERQNRKSTDWAVAISKFLLGRATEAELSAAIPSPYPRVERERRCEFWYYTGMKRLLEGDAPAAFGNFQKCLATGSKDVVAYDSARMELNRRGK